MRRTEQRIMIEVVDVLEPIAYQEAEVPPAVEVGIVKSLAGTDVTALHLCRVIVAMVTTAVESIEANGTPPERTRITRADREQTSTKSGPDQHPPQNANTNARVTAVIEIVTATATATRNAENAIRTEVGTVILIVIGNPVTAHLIVIVTRIGNEIGIARKTVTVYGTRTALASSIKTIEVMTENRPLPALPLQ
jgi:hypothetical protein